MKWVVRRVGIIVLQLLVASLTVAVIFLAGGFIARNPIYFQIFLMLVPAVIALFAAYIPFWYATRDKKQSEAKSVTVKGSSQPVHELIKIYQDHLRNDSRIAELRIMDMHQPLDIMSIYIQMRIHQESHTGYKLDADSVDAANKHRNDPEELLKASRRRIKSLADNNDAKDPIQVIEKNRRCLIVGDPGTGKTTLLKYLALKSIDEFSPHLPDFPIYIELHSLVSHLKSDGRIHPDDLLDWAASLWDQRYNIAVPKEIIIRIMKDRLAEGRVLLLLDGLDETIIGETQEKAKESYLRVIAAITDFSTRYKQAPIVVTVRKAVYQQQKKPLDGFEDFEVMEFLLDDIKQYVQKWFVKYHNPQKPANLHSLIDLLESNPRIQALATNPLLLSLMVVAYEANLDLPDRRAMLYRQCVATLMSEWDRVRAVERRSEFSMEHKSKLLEEIAWHFHWKRQCYFSESELLFIIASFLQRLTKAPVPDGGKEILAEITAEHGLLKEQVKGLYGFLHLTLQEYFVALYAIDHGKIDMVLAHRGDPWWEEVVLLYAGCTNDLLPLLQILIGNSRDGFLQEDIFNTNLLLAGRSLAARSDYAQDSYSNVIHRLFDELSSTAFSLTKMRIVNTLFEIGGESVNKRLLSLFFTKQTDPAIHQSIARALISQGRQDAANALIERLVDSRTDAATCGDIAEVLGGMNEPSVAPRLLELYAQSRFTRSIEIRLSLVAAPGAAARHSMSHALLEKISHTLSGYVSQEPEPRMRQGIIEALGELGEYSIIPALVQFLSSEVNYAVRGSIVYALGILGRKALADPLLKREKEHLPNRKEKISPDICEALGEALITNLLQAQHQLIKKRIPHFYQSYAGATGRYIANVLLQELFNAKEHVQVRQSAAEALGVLGEHSAARMLGQLLATESNAFIRSTVAYSLGLLGEKSVADTLLQSFTRERETAVRLNIATALGMLGEPAVVPHLKHLLTQEKGDIRASIAAALGKLEKDSMTSELLDILIDGGVDPIVCRRIADTLSASGTQSSVLARLRQLANPQIEMSVYDLLRRLADRQIEVSIRKKIASILYEFNRDAAVPALVELLTRQRRQPGASVVEHIVIILEQLASDEETIRMLLMLLNEPGIIDTIHRALWTVCRRAGVTVIRNSQGAFEVVKWGDPLFSKQKIVLQQARQFLPLSKPPAIDISTIADQKTSPQFAIPGLFSQASRV